MSNDGQMTGADGFAAAMIEAELEAHSHQVGFEPEVIEAIVLTHRAVGPKLLDTTLGTLDVCVPMFLGVNPATAPARMRALGIAMYANALLNINILHRSSLDQARGDAVPKAS